ncbi:hypothetical protein [Vibrio harveyi]|uniref:hypothetical protein n=1 Tax=Vibrio harveyi TaxID=669 RepID=UPI003BB5162B
MKTPTITAILATLFCLQVKAGSLESDKLEYLKKLQATAPNKALALQQIDMSLKMNCQINLKAEELNHLLNRSEVQAVIMKVSEHGMIGLTEVKKTIQPLMKQMGC